MSYVNGVLTILPTPVDVADIVQLIMTGQYDEKADLNKDNKVDAADLVLLINKVE